METDKLFAPGQSEIVLNPAQRRTRTGAIALAVALHLIVIGTIVYMPRHKPVRVSVAHEGGITAFVNVATPVGTTGVKPAASKPKPTPAPKALAVMPTKIAPANAVDAPGAQQVAGI